MTSDFLKDVLKQLETNDPEAIEQCLNEVQTLLPTAGDQELGDLVGASTRSSITIPMNIRIYSRWSTAR